LIVTNYNALNAITRAKTLAVHLGINSEDKVKAVGKITSARAQQNSALLIVKASPELHCINLARSSHKNPLWVIVPHCDAILKPFRPFSVPPCSVYIILFIYL
jgi:hypothetical protein